MNKPITIVGGGLAGLTLGIGLRQHGVPVTIWEAGCYPRHRVCGEFISGSGQAVLERMGLLEKLMQAGALVAQTVSFHASFITTPPLRLPQPALCISRYVLDSLLAREFCHLGGQLLEGRRWTDPAGEGVVLACGRRCEPVVNGWRWIGLKAHAENVTLDTDLEMHLLANGYAGICRLPQGRVNVCALLRSRTTFGDLSREWPERLRGPEGSTLRARLADAVFEPQSMCVVAGIDLRPQRACKQSECCLGDALTMIAPMTGNGMSMAFESADLAIPPLVEYSCWNMPWSERRILAKAHSEPLEGHALSWPSKPSPSDQPAAPSHPINRAAIQKIARACDLRFFWRLRWAALLQWAIFHPWAARPCLALGSVCPPFWKILFWSTRR